MQHHSIVSTTIAVDTYTSDQGPTFFPSSLASTLLGGAALRRVERRGSAVEAGLSVLGGMLAVYLSSDQ